MLKKVLLICIICLLVCGLVSCGGTSTFEKSDKVTEEEWLDAFDLSDVEKMTIDFELKSTVKEPDDENEFQSKGTVVCKNNVINANYTEISDGEEDEKSWKEEYDTLDFYNIEVAEIHALSYWDSRYELCEYSDNTGAYELALDTREESDADMRGSGVYSFWFKDGNISKISLSGSWEVDNGNFSMTATYNFKY